ncbi:MAG: copper oxidase [Xanthomonadales bacterium]|nr:copper oxidase [Xanthomonadales bacterium]
MAWALLILCAAASAQDHDHGAHRMGVDATGMTMNANQDILPEDCDRISGEHEFEVRAGRVYAEPYPGLMFGFSEAEIEVEPCSLVTVTLVNEDDVRHQWMLHGLPRYLYPGGMFHLEAEGGHSRTASFIVPSDERTYLVHCDLPQHMEKGMKAQLKAGRGSGDLWSIPGVSAERYPSPSRPGRSAWLAIPALIAGLVLAGAAWRIVGRRRR